MRIGVDLGGTKIESVAIDDAGTERARLRVATPSHSYDEIIASIVRLVADTEARAGQKGTVGIGIPGALSPATGLVKNANTVVLNGRPLDRDLAQALGRPVRVANDANCFALSEASDGAGAGCRVVFGVIVGTGTGGGVVVDGKILTGPHAIAGEWGHNPLPWPRDDERPGPACYCGKSACIETFLAGPSLARDHQRHTGETCDASEISRRAEAGSPTALSTLARHADRMARSLASVINILDPDVIVLGGGVSNIPYLYREIPLRLGQYVFSDTISTPIRPARHGDSSGVRGAAWLWPVGG
jgi:fructokinase